MTDDADPADPELSDDAWRRPLPGQLALVDVPQAEPPPQTSGPLPLPFPTG